MKTQPTDLETIYSREAVETGLREMLPTPPDAITVEAVYKLVHYLIQMGRADALWELTNEWAKEGKQNAAGAAYQKHVDARDNAAERRGELKLLLATAFGKETEKVVPDGSLN